MVWDLSMRDLSIIDLFLSSANRALAVMSGTPQAVREYPEPLRDRGLLYPRASSSDELGIREHRCAVRSAECQKVSVLAAI